LLVLTRAAISRKNYFNSTRWSFKGLTWFTPGEDQGLVSRSQLLARIIISWTCNGTDHFGDPEIWQVQVTDVATNIARQMAYLVMERQIGPLEDDNNEQMFMWRIMMPLVDLIEVCKIINHCEQIAKIGFR
jgi:cell division protease FtsH